ncbi:hypothetical protein KRM28CT15_18420 [Krasilnikovia sp. M28-CT-15]
MAVAAAPIAISLLLVDRWLNRSLREYLPIQSDELSNWHQSATFAAVGFDNGYYSYQEQIGAVSGYGPWGPGFAVLMGAGMRVIGTSYLSVVAICMAAVFLIVAGALAFARVPWQRVLLVGVVLATFPPMLIYLPSGMQESLHLAIAVLMATLFARLLQAPPGGRQRLAIALVATCSAAALIRPTWALMLVAVAAAAARGRPARVMWIWVGAATASALGFAVIYMAWAAPFPYLALAHIRAASGIDQLSLLGDNVWANLRLLLIAPGLVMYTNSVQHYQLIALLGVGVLLVVWWSRIRNGTDVAALSRAVGVTVLLAVVPPTALIIVLYDMENGTRTLAPCVLFSALLLALVPVPRAWVVPVVLVASNLAALSLLQHDFVTRNRLNFDGDRTRVAAAQAELGRMMRFRADAEPWCNTVLSATDYGLRYELAAVPAGFGIGIDYNHQFRGPLKSAYVIATSDFLTKFPATTTLRQLSQTSLGNLYLNQNSPCFQHRAD